MRSDLIVVGGGAAGMFAACSAKAACPNARVLLLEKSAVLLAKVRISGGGRCNVTHHCFDEGLLVQNYPRGSKELRGMFSRFQPKDTVAWFEARGVKLKVEKDGRMFPITDSSQTIIQCLMDEAQKLGCVIKTVCKIERVEKTEEGFFRVTLRDGDQLEARKLILATGSSADGHEIARGLGHQIEPSIPSLFTFNVPNSPLSELSGIAVNPATVEVVGFAQKMTGPLLITHFGFSGPAVLKLSAFAAKFLHEKQYRVEMKINYLPDLSEEEIFLELEKLKKENGDKFFVSVNSFAFSARLWGHFLAELGDKRLRDVSKKELKALASKLHGSTYQVSGKTTNKEEFVTCGGVARSEVDFKTMESKQCSGLYLAGEVLDIDGITGGFNFQNAWTSGFLAGRNAVVNLQEK